jgi:hypothetical protein
MVLLKINLNAPQHAMVAVQVRAVVDQVVVDQVMIHAKIAKY